MVHPCISSLPPASRGSFLIRKAGVFLLSSFYIDWFYFCSSTAPRSFSRTRHGTKEKPHVFSSSNHSLSYARGVVGVGICVVK